MLGINKLNFKGRFEMKKNLMFMLTLALLIFVSGNAVAQDSNLRLELHGGIGLPTFDIADAAEIGPGAGVGIWYSPVDARWTLGAEADFGMHGGADVDVDGETETGPDVNVYHLMGKAGYFVYASDDSKLQVVVNAGAGMVMFDIDAPDTDMESYFGINAGSKIYYAVSPSIDFVVSLQGDISFTDEDVLGTNNAWVWPLSLGFAIKL
jgi:hypothetical protein